ncbi:MAG: hypothetical protein P8N52_07940 [Crocinitomicaceae bacterium]|nr:hypothetical protein [Crocinitomicaceae bacterium]MDG1776603.1 hypothetical protein [Crocinitomicaceae bacterium]
MKLLISLVAVLCLSQSYAQTQTTNYTDTRLFAQCMFDISDQSEMQALQNEMYNNPNIEMVRLDYHTQRALIITANLETLSRADFISWFDEYAYTIHCVQIGVHGIDVMNPYPFTNCQ